MLRFDVETLIIATIIIYYKTCSWLRFDVETLIIATDDNVAVKTRGCGLM